MTKIFKCLAVILTAVILAAVLTDAPADAAHNPALFEHVGSEVPGAGALFSNDGGSTWTATITEYLAGEADAGGDNGDGPTAGTFQGDRFTAQWSNDGGLTWTATRSDYFAGEHNAAGDNDDGPGAGTFRSRTGAHDLYSIDGGLTWRGSWSYREYFAGEADAGGDNGDGPTAGTFRFRSSPLEYSFDGGSTWMVWFPARASSALNPQYLAGEADAGGDNGDGPTAGTFRFRVSSEMMFYAQCRGDLSSFRVGTSRPDLSCSGDPTSTTFTWNVDDGIEPTGDWCVSGRTPADISMICRGEGYTYREARRELGFGLGRP